MSKVKLTVNPPLVEQLEKNRLAFIQNATLKTNVAIAMQYISFLRDLEAEVELPGFVAYSTFKTIIVNTASVVESVLHYGINEKIQNGEINESEVMPVKETYSQKKMLYDIPESHQQVIGGIIELKTEELKDNTNFITINRACRKAGILDENLFNEVEYLRELRNKIHLVALKDRDDYYNKDHINQVFNTATKVLDAVESETNKQ